MADASTIDNSLLITLVEKYPILWDRSVLFYKNRFRTKATWKRILKSLYPDYASWNDETRKAYVNLIKQRWTHIRDNYHKSLRKRVEKGSDAKPFKPYLYSTRLAFLQKVLPFDDSVDSEDVEVNVKTESQKKYCESIVISDNSFDTNDMGSTSSNLENTTGLEDSHTQSDNANEPFPTQTPPESQESNRHLLFFKGIMPSLNDFNDNETIDFQMGVLKLVKDIKNSRQGQQFPSFNIKFEDDLVSQ